MGFLNTFKKIVSAPRMVVASVVKGIGQLAQNVNASPILIAGWAIEEFGELITPECYKRESATVNSTINVGEDCKKYFNLAKETLNPKLEQYCGKEKNRINECKEQIQLLVPDTVFLRIKAQIPQNPYDEACKACWDMIAERVSTDNDEFLKCLKIEDDKARKAECHAYVVKTVNSVIQQTGKCIVEKTREIIQLMLTEVEEYMRRQSTQLQEKYQELNDLQEQKDDPEFIVRRLSRTYSDIGYLSCILSTSNRMG